MGWFGRNNHDAETREGERRTEAGPDAQAPPPAVDEVRASLAGLATAGPFADDALAQAEAQAPEPRASASTFSDTVEIEGSIEGHGDVHLEGRVAGSVNITGALVVEPSGLVRADVSAREVVNAGTVEGNVAASERIRIRATGVVLGDIEAPSVVIEEGGGVEGFVQMEGNGRDEPEEDAFVAPTPLTVSKRGGAAPRAALFGTRAGPAAPQPVEAAAERASEAEADVAWPASASPALEPAAPASDPPPAT